MMLKIVLLKASTNSSKAEKYINMKPFTLFVVIFQEYITEDCDTLSYEDFVDLYQKITLNSEISLIFLKNSADKMFLTVRELYKFIQVIFQLKIKSFWGSFQFIYAFASFEFNFLFRRHSASMTLQRTTVCQLLNNSK